MRQPRVFALAFALLLSACPQSCLIQRTAPLSSAPQPVLPAAAPAAPKAPIVSKSAPVPQHAGKGIFGEEIEFVGYDTDPLQPRAGQPVVITDYFHALKDVRGDWELFVHVDDRGSALPRINGDHYPAQGALRTNQWKAGDYVADRFALELPETDAKHQLDLWTGFYQGEERLPISNPKDCTNDGNNRLLAGTLNIE